MGGRALGWGGMEGGELVKRRGNLDGGNVGEVEPLLL